MTIKNALYALQDGVLSKIKEYGENGVQAAELGRSLNLDLMDSPPHGISRNSLILSISLLLKKEGKVAIEDTGENPRIFYKGE